MVSAPSCGGPAAEAAAALSRGPSAPAAQRPALRNRPDSGDVVEPSGKPDRQAATTTLAAWIDRQMLTADEDDTLLVTFDGHQPAPLTSTVMAAAYLAEVEYSTPYAEALAAAQAVLAAADVDAAVAVAAARARARDRVARERRRRVEAEQAEQARRRAALVAALNEARSGAELAPERGVHRGSASLAGDER